MIRVILADDHTIVRSGLRLMLESDPEIEIVGEAADGNQAYSLTAREKPDILLLDISMPPGQSGLVACEKVVQDFPSTRVIILTMFAEPDYLLFTLRGGASGYVLKNATAEELCTAVHTVSNGGTYIYPKMADLLKDHMTSGKVDSSQALHALTGREIEITSLLAHGFTNKEIAEKLYLSVKTVEAHRSKIYAKLGIKSRSELVDFAIKHKLLEL